MRNFLAMFMVILLAAGCGPKPLPLDVAKDKRSAGKPLTAEETVMLHTFDVDSADREESLRRYRAERSRVEAAEQQAAAMAADRLAQVRAKQAAGKKLTSAETALISKAEAEAAAAKAEAKAADEERQRDTRRNAWARAAVLECQMQGQMAAAAASNPRALIDIIAAATGAQVRDTCIEMKRAQMDSMQF